MMLILVNAAAMGLETWPALSRYWGWLLGAINIGVQALFVAEVTIRIAAHGCRPFGFFRSGWNVFDFAVVAVSLLPVVGPLATVARLARVLRVGRLATGMPELRLIIGTMLRSIPSMGREAQEKRHGFRRRRLRGTLVEGGGVLSSRCGRDHWSCPELG